MQPFFDALAQLLAWFYDLVPNYAVAIILLTLVVMIVVTPLTLKGTRSMMVMQQLQPEMKKIQQKYKDDRQKLNEELLKFYKENDINPLGGCLPLFIQMPVFLVLYQVLRGLTRRESGLGFNVGWVSGEVLTGQEPTTPQPPVRTFDPAYLDPSSSMYQSLHGSTTMSAFGIDLAESCSQALNQGFVHALPFIVLIAIVGTTGFIQQKQIQGRNPNAQVNPQQQMLMRVMPIVLPVISFGLPAGLVLYFAVSNLYRIGQQAFISRSIYGIKRGDKNSGSKVIDAASTEVSGGKSSKKALAEGSSAKESKGQGSKGSGSKGQGAKGQGGRSRSGGGKGAKGRGGGRAPRGAGNGQGAPTLQPRARKKKR